MARKQLSRCDLGDYSSGVNENRIKFLCFELGDKSRRVQLIWCSAGVFFFYLLYGYLQELIFTLDGFRPFGWYLTLLQFAYYTIFAWFETRLRGISRRIPFGTYSILALLTLGTMGFSNSSLGYLNYPTQVIFKCCKLIPVLIGGILIQGKKYDIPDFASAGLLCCGLVLFTLADSMISPRFDVLGVAMIGCALLCDAVIGNLQEKAMKRYNASNTEVIFYSYAIGFAYLLTILSCTGQLVNGAAFCFQHPVETYGYAFIFSLCGYFGVQIVLALVHCCDAFVAATVTTCRKAVTILISFLLFYKPFTFQYLWSGFLIVLGIYLNICSKQKRKAGDKLAPAAMWSRLLSRWKHYNRVQSHLMTNV